MPCKLRASPAFLAFILLTTTLTLAWQETTKAASAATAGPKMPNMKQPDSFIDKDGSFLIPGIGRFILPQPGQNPFDYNPVTGNNNNGGAGSGTSDQHIPGGDDTFGQNPGPDENPTPGAGEITP